MTSKIYICTFYIHFSQIYITIKLLLVFFLHLFRRIKCKNVTFSHNKAHKQDLMYFLKPLLNVFCQCGARGYLHIRNSDIKATLDMVYFLKFCHGQYFWCLKERKVLVTQPICVLTPEHFINFASKEAYSRV